MDAADIDSFARSPLSPLKITTDEYYRMEEIGILRGEMRVELIEGQIFEMSPVGPRHQLVIDELNRILVSNADANTTVRIQGPIRLDKHHAPQPDVAMVARRWQAYPKDHPGPADVYLLIEVADSSLPVDRGFKAELYARFGIREYWIVDLTQDQVIVHRNPENGVYRSVHNSKRDRRLRIAALPTVSFAVDALFE